MGKAKQISILKSGLAEIATSTDLKKSEVKKVLDSLSEVATAQVKSVGKFTVPGLVMIKTRKKPATKAGTKQAFGKTITVKAKPAKTVVKAFCVSGLKIHLRR